ncbi:MAG: hypothetical protein IKU39_04965 [Lachnospiraceae bacterium]|nr:hypothetical protein [Lachnospiraceae bacterium]
MVNEERIKLMTRMAAYEKEEHKKNKKIVSFFKSDYISMQTLKSIVYTTIAFAIMFGLYVLYDFEIFMKEIYQMDIFEFAKSVIIVYGIFMGIILVITYVVSLYQYKRAIQSTKLYYANLKKLSRDYGAEE